MTDSDGHTPLHHAVYFGNFIAIEIIQNHLESIGEKIDWNPLCIHNRTPLNYVGGLCGSLKLT